jgi:hypothetical protein
LTDAEILALYTEYKTKRARKEVKLSFLDWAARTITDRFSYATSRAGKTAVYPTLRPILREHFEHELRMVTICGAV